MKEPRWECRRIEPDDTLKGWVCRVPGDKWPTELAEHALVHILERRGKSVKVSAPTCRRYHLRVEEVDCGYEWRVTSDWLPESHPRVLAMLQDRLTRLRSSPLEAKETESKRAEKIRYVEWVLRRNGVQIAAT